MGIARHGMALAQGGDPHRRWRGDRSWKPHTHYLQLAGTYDGVRNQVFAGDFIYQHSGGIIAFASGSDLAAYKANSTRLLQLTNSDALFFGAHGLPRFGRDWLTLLDRELDKIVRGDAEYRYVTHYLAPGIPWRVHQNREMFIYTTPLVDPPLFWSKWMLLVLALVSILALYLLCRIHSLTCRLLLRKG